MYININSVITKVAISLRAVDRLLGNDEAGQQVMEEDSHPHPAAAEGKENKASKTAASGTKKTLKSAWFRWGMEYHTFRLVS
jgi:hypothetical protein